MKRVGRKQLDGGAAQLVGAKPAGDGKPAPAKEAPVDIWGAVEFLKMSRDWVYRRAVEGTLPSYKLGKARKFYISELDAYVKSQRGE